MNTSLATIAAGARTTWAFCVAHGQLRNVTSVRSTCPALAPTDSLCASVLDTKLLHFDGSEEEASLELAKRARAVGVVTSLDGGSVRATTERLIEHIDLLVMCEEFLEELRPNVARAEALRQLHTAERRITAVTLGSQGCMAFDGQELYEIPAEPVSVVDTTGAGDVFHGALLAALLKDIALPEALGFATHVAGRKCQQLGGQAGIPFLHDLDSLA